MSEIQPLLSIIIPVFNEMKNIPVLMERLKKALATLEGRYEVICVNDGSTDSSLETLKSRMGALNLRVIELARNYGQLTATLAGMENASGKYVMTMDADLQNHPEDILKLLGKIEEGYDMVNGVRVHRSAPFHRRVSTRMANWFFSRVVGYPITDSGSGIKMYRGELFDDISDYGEMGRYPMEYAIWKGASVAEVEVADSERASGSSNYGMKELALMLIDWFLLFSSKSYMIYVLLPAGVVCFVFGFALALYLTITGFIRQVPFINTNLLLLSLLLIIVGMLSASMAIINERISRVYRKMERKKLYSVKKIWAGNKQ